MSQDNIAIGHSPLDELLPVIGNEDKQLNLDQLLSVEIIPTSQSLPLIPFNSTMTTATTTTTTTTPMIANIPQSNDTLNTPHDYPIQQHQQVNRQRLDEQQRLQHELYRLQREQGQIQREQHRIRQRLQSDEQRLRQQHQRQQQRQRQQQQNEQQLQRQERNQRRYEQCQEHVNQREQTGHQQQQHYNRYYERYLDRYQQDRYEQEYYAYLERRSPTFDERADEILTEQELEEYYFNRMKPQHRQDIWEQEYLNELQGYPSKCSLLLPTNHIENYTEFLQEQLSLDQYEQAMQINEMEKDDSSKERQRNQELLIQKREWEALAFRLQQHLQ